MIRRFQLGRMTCYHYTIPAIHTRDRTRTSTLYRQQILSLPWLPLHHRGIAQVYIILDFDNFVNGIKAANNPISPEACGRNRCVWESLTPPTFCQDHTRTIQGRSACQGFTFCRSLLFAKSGTRDRTRTYTPFRTQD